MDTMRRFIFILLALVSLLPVQAKVDAGQLLGGLLQMVNEPKPAASSPASVKEPSIGEQILLSLRGATDTMLESYKKEGREYAREVGDIITQRIIEDKKINSTLDSMRICCWVVVIYLFVVTLLVIYLLFRLRVLYALLSRKIDAIPQD